MKAEARSAEATAAGRDAQLASMQAEAAQLFHDLVFGDNEPDSDAPDNGDKEAAGGGNDDTGADLEEPGDG